MKKVMISLLLLGATAVAANAASKTEKMHRHHIRIDHSKDMAYSAAWAKDAQPPADDANFSLGDDYTTGRYRKGKTWYYGLHNVTVHSAVATTMNAPYLGEPAPSWEGPALDNYRNMRINKPDFLRSPKDGEVQARR
ncbi:MAG: hypothetical protein JST06_00945 [Bacteroidetes bacterium]|nr:hypothetical protein [Bacteroidota bacterium]MBS1630162.1 hypothetical protein [Bacteroidota bacterium]